MGPNIESRCVPLLGSLQLQPPHKPYLIQWDQRLIAWKQNTDDPETVYSLIWTLSLPSRPCPTHIRTLFVNTANSGKSLDSVSCKPAWARYAQKLVTSRKLLITWEGQSGYINCGPPWA